MKKYYEIQSFDCNMGPLIRDLNIKYQKNEIKLEVIEQLNVLISKNQSIIKNEIIGEVKVIPRLSGYPIIYLGVNNLCTYWHKNDYIDVSRNSMEIDDIIFYNTVNFDDDDKNILRFIPPDKKFVLIKYQKSSRLDPLITIEAITKRLKDSRVELIFDARSHFSQNFIAQNVLISIPIFSDDESIDFKSSIGEVKYLKNENKLNWLITQFPGKEQFLLHVYVKLNSVDNKSKEIKSIKVNFEIPSMTASRFSISSLNVSNTEDYKVFQSISYVTKVQNYEIII